MLPAVLRRYVFIFHEAALGDFLMTWPLVLGAARVWPQRRVVVVTAKGKGRLASDVLRVEHDDAECWADLFSTGGRGRWWGSASAAGCCTGRGRRGGGPTSRRRRRRR